jgi:hypothetical protein
LRRQNVEDGEKRREEEEEELDIAAYSAVQDRHECERTLTHRDDGFGNAQPMELQSNRSGVQWTLRIQTLLTAIPCFLSIQLIYTNIAYKMRQTSKLTYSPPTSSLST